MLNLKKIVSSSGVAKVASRTLASHATSAKSSEKPEVKITTTPAGAMLATVPSDFPELARVAIVVRAGARFEPRDHLGLTHIIRSLGGYAGKNFTTFGIHQNIQYHGGRLQVVGSRDTISYLLEVPADADVLPKLFSMLADTVSRPAFKPWEITDNTERINTDLSIVADTPYIQLAEALHSVAFKGGLRKSLYTPKYMVGKHESERLKKYVQERFVSPAIVGVGIEHQQLTELVGTNINLGSHQPPKCVSKFIGGETHIDAAGPLTYVAIAGEGVGIQNTKEAVALSLFQNILGSGNRIQNAYGTSSATRLGKALKGSSDVAASAFNINYQEIGLFGLNLIVPSSADVTGLVKKAIKELRSAAGSISDAELAGAKASLKVSSLLAVDSGDALALELGNQLALTGNKIDIVSVIDSITAADVQAIAGKVVKSKAALATIGPNAPFLDDLA